MVTVRSGPPLTKARGGGDGRGELRGIREKNIRKMTKQASKDRQVGIRNIPGQQSSTQFLVYGPVSKGQDKTKDR